MILQNIYNDIFQDMDDDYYVELAEREVMVIPVLIDIMFGISPIYAVRAQEILETISLEKPKLVYPFFEYLERVIDSTNLFLAWNTWKIITNLLDIDSEGKWERVSKRFIDALNSENISEFSITCECAQRIIKSKPSESEKILAVFSNIDNRVFKISGEVSEASKQVAKEKIQEFFENVMK